MFKGISFLFYFTFKSESHWKKARYLHQLNELSISLHPLLYHNVAWSQSPSECCGSAGFWRIKLFELYDCNTLEFNLIMLHCWRGSLLLCLIFCQSLSLWTVLTCYWSEAAPPPHPTPTSPPYRHTVTHSLTHKCVLRVRCISYL